jgi:hypothetical protein
MKKTTFFSLLAAAAFCLPMQAQDLKLNGIGHLNRHEDAEQMTSDYVGWNNDLQKAIFIVEQGIYTMSWDGLSLTTPKKEPPVNKADFYSGGKFTDNAKAVWANNFNLMYGNSGAVYVDGQLVTVMSRDEQSTPDEELFAVRKWNAKTGDLLSSEIRPKSDCLESAGMSYNPKDGKVYGLFYLTEQKLREEITSDPEYFTDEEGEASSTDAGYAICTIDLATMKVTPITPGLYYYNFITFAINSEGRAFALTSGGSSGYLDDNGRMRNADNELAGAQLCEFDLQTGLMKMNATKQTDPETKEEYTEYTHPIGATGYSSQYRRQSACFAKSNPGKMYWNGYFNSGKGINEWGSWSSLSDKEWRTNGKYDTCLYEVDINTGEATRLSNIKERWIFSALWADGDDASDGAGISVTAGIAQQEAATGASRQQAYNLRGQLVEGSQTPGIYVVRQDGKTRKVVVR